MSADRIAIETLAEDAILRINALRREGPHLVVCFASVGKGWHLMPPDEFVGTIAKMPQTSALFVSDMTRSWMNNAHLRETVARVVCSMIAAEGITRVTTLGLSMGGFSALVASRLFPVDTAIALSPQFSILRDLIPGERRWRHWTGKVIAPDYPSVLPLSDQGRLVVVHGLGDDMAHMRAFPVQDNLDHFVFPDAKHSEIGMMLKRSGQLGPFLTAAAEHNKQGMVRALRSLGGIWRGRYEARFSEEPR
jgi:pimeloyl-ACP methyl ester carboxylesterase